MKILFIFDSFLVVEKMNISFLKHADTVYLFPLTSQFAMTTVLEENLKKTGCEVKIIQTARMINDSAEDLRDKYIRFIAEFPKQVQRKQKDLKELFAIDEYTSLWWFSLIAEKSPFKSDSFNRLVQLDSIVRVTKGEKIDKIMFACQSEKLKNALRKYSCKNGIKFVVLPTESIRNLKMRFRESQKLLYFKHSIILINSLIHTLLKTQAVKKQIGSLRRTISQVQNPLLIFTYYPELNEPLAAKAMFRDRTYIHLQEALENNRQNIIWIAIYVYYNNISLKKSLEYAKRFIKNGYIIFFIEEFNSLWIQIKALFTVLKSGFKFFRLEKSIYKTHNFEDYNIYSLFKDDWYSSFCGETGYGALMYYYMFKSALKKLKVKKCLYPCEMQEWEKALISARDALGIETSLYGYVSGTVSRMLLNCFNHPEEVSDGGSYALPQPDKIVCNGRLPYAYMKESGWPEEKLSIGEALKYSYLKRHLNSQSSDKKQNIVLLAFSISPEESSSILNIVYEAFKDKPDVEVWLRPHPALRLENVFKLSGMSVKNFPFKIKNGRLEDILLKVKVVIAGESSVSIEAIACGCNVVIVEVPEWINMSPLKGIYSQVIKTADSPQSLQGVILSIFQEEYDSQRHTAEARKIINDFFYLNQENDTPHQFLKLIMNADE